MNESKHELLEYDNLDRASGMVRAAIVILTSCVFMILGMFGSIPFGDFSALPEFFENAVLL